jgi:hypothetical protein
MNIRLFQIKVILVLTFFGILLLRPSAAGALGGTDYMEVPPIGPFDWGCIPFGVCDSVTPAPSTPSQPEICGDGIDNNVNGLVDENCQPQAITLSQPVASCSGSSPLVSLNWSGTVTQSKKQLVSRDNTGLREALFQADTNNQIAILPAPGGSGGSSSGAGSVITYTVLRDGSAIGSTGQTSFDDTSPLSGSHNYLISAVNSSFITIQSIGRSIETSNCGSSIPSIQVRILGPATDLKHNQSYDYQAQVVDSSTGQPITTTTTSSINMNWQLLYSRIGTIARSSINQEQSTVYTGTCPFIGSNETDAVTVDVTATLNGQPVSGTASLNVGMNDPCPPPPPPDQIPGTPTLAGLATCSSVNTPEMHLSWNDAGNTTYYVLYRDASQLAVTSQNTKVDDGVTAGASYVYTVRAFNNANRSQLSNSITLVGSCASVGNGGGGGGGNGIVPSISGPQTLKRSASYTYTTTVRVNGQNVPIVPAGTTAGSSSGGGSSGGSGGLAAISNMIDFNDLPTRMSSGVQRTRLYEDRGVIGLGGSILALAIQDLGNGRCQDYQYNPSTQPPQVDPITKQPLPQPPAPTQWAVGIAARPSQTLFFTNNQVADQVSFDVVDSGGPSGFVAFDGLDKDGNIIPGTSGQVPGRYCDPNYTIRLNKGLSSGIQAVRFRQVGSGVTLGPDFIALDNYAFSPLYAPASGGSGGGSGSGGSGGGIPSGGTYAEIVDWQVLTTSGSGIPIGSINTNSTSGALTTGSSPSIGRSSGTIIVHLIVYINGVPTPTTATLPIAINDPSFLTTLGDIFGRGISGISVGRNSVVSSSGTVSVDREGGSQQLDIPNYDPGQKLKWATIKDANGSTVQGIQRLKLETSKTIDRIPRESTFNLNPKEKGNFRDLLNDDTNPEGAVWHVAGDLVLSGDMIFKGRGTIIVDGKVSIQGSVRYDPNDSKSMLGIISLDQSSGDKITFMPATQNASIVGAYFAPFGAINFGPNLATATGLFVADTVTIDSSLVGFGIVYDGRITENPLPGFKQSFVPSLSETAP